MVSLREADEKAGEVEKGGTRQDTGGQREGMQGRCHSGSPMAGSRVGGIRRGLRERWGLSLLGHDAFLSERRKPAGLWRCARCS
jgi:hypothetical protein